MPFRTKVGLEIQKDLVKLWQERPVGTEVLVMKDDGVEVRSRITAPAQLLGGHTAVIWLEGISGCYALSRVRSVPKPLPPDPDEDTPPATGPDGRR